MRKLKQFKVTSLDLDINTILSCFILSKNNYIKLSSSDSQKIPVLITVKTKDDNDKAVKSLENYRPPIDLICVIDHSGSMAGLVKKSIYCMKHLNTSFQY